MTVTDKLVLICLMTGIIHASETLSYAIRYAGVRSGKLAVSLSLAGMVLLVSRTSNLIQAPMMGKIIDHAKENPGFDLEGSLRYIIASSSVGTLLSIVLFPSLVFLFARLIVRFDTAGSLPKLVTSLTLEQVKNAKHHLKKPTWTMLKSLRLMGIPKRLLALNCLVTAIYTVGVLASLYAAYLAPQFSTTASQSSGLINGVATIIFTIMVDPQMAMLTDRALGSERDRRRLGKVMGMLMISRFAGTLLAQLLLIPATHWIIWVIRFI